MHGNKTYCLEVFFLIDGRDTSALLGVVELVRPFVAAVGVTEPGGLVSNPGEAVGVMLPIVSPVDKIKQNSVLLKQSNSQHILSIQPTAG